MGFIQSKIDKMKQKKHTQNEKIARLEKVVTQLYLKIAKLQSDFNKARTTPNVIKEEKI